MHKPIDNWDMPLNYSKAKYKKKIPKASIIKHSIPSSNFNHIFQNLIIKNDVSKTLKLRNHTQNNYYDYQNKKQNYLSNQPQQYDRKYYKNIKLIKQEQNSNNFDIIKSSQNLSKQLLLSHNPKYQYSQQCKTPIKVQETVNLPFNKLNIRSNNNRHIPEQSNLGNYFITQSSSRSPVYRNRLSFPTHFDSNDCSIEQKMKYEDIIDQQNDIIKQNSRKINLQRKSGTKTVTQQSQSNSKKKYPTKVIDIFRIYELKQKGKNTARQKLINENLEQQQMIGSNKKRNYLSKYEQNKNKIIQKQQQSNNLMLPFVLQSIQQIKISNFSSPKQNEVKQINQNQDKIQKLKIGANIFCQKRQKTVNHTNFNLKTLDRNLQQININLKKIQSLKQKKITEHTIIEYPVGKVLTLIIYDNWGHPDFVALQAIQIYDSNANLVFPIKINSLPQNTLKSKPQSLFKLFNRKYIYKDIKYGGVVCNLQDKKTNLIRIQFETKIRIGMIRIWNYNLGFEGATMGIKTIQIKLDTQYIFGGSIKKGNGNRKDFYLNCEYILLSNKQEYIKQIQNKDWLNDINVDHFNSLQQKDINEQQFQSQQDSQENHINCQKGFKIQIIENYGNSQEWGFRKMKLISKINKKQIMYMIEEGNHTKNYSIINQKIIHVRIQHQAIIQKIVFKNLQDNKAIKSISITLDKSNKTYLFSNLIKKTQSQILQIYSYFNIDIIKKSQNPILKQLKIYFKSNWGHHKLIGINKIQLYDNHAQPILTNTYFIPHYINFQTILNRSSNPTQFNYHQNDWHFQSQYTQISIKFQQPILISAICIWNCKLDRSTGVKQYEIKGDGKILVQGYLSAFCSLSKFSVLMLCKNEFTEKRLNGYIQVIQQYNQTTIMYNEQKQRKCINKLSILN